MRLLSARSLLFGALFVAALGCSSTDEEFPADTARVSLDDRSRELDIANCALDEDLGVFVLAGSSSDSLLQLLLVVDGDETDLAASAVSFTIDGLDLGAGAADRLGVVEGAPGVIDVATIRGDRIDVEAEVRVIDTGSAAVASTGDPLRLDAVARCPADDAA